MLNEVKHLRLAGARPGLKPQGYKTTPHKWGLRGCPSVWCTN